MADRSQTYATDKDGVTRTTSVGATKSAGDVAAANARAKYDPSMRRPDASSLDNSNVSPLGLAAKRAAAARAAASGQGRAKAVKKMLKDTDNDGM